VWGYGLAHTPEGNIRGGRHALYVGPSLQKLHEDYAKKHHIDEKAPLRERRTNKGAHMKARFAVIDEERELAWTGVAVGGAKAVQRHCLESQPDGTTKVTVEESMAGPILALAFSNAKLTALLQTSLGTLKAAGEAAA
jgi:hypothetical protein